MNSHQVVVIGGGLAGAACAIELRSRGMDAVAFDRDQFPRRKVCGEFLSPGALRCLDDLGLLDRVRSEGAVAVTGVRIRFDGDREIDIPFDGIGLGFSRERLDEILAREADVRTGHRVENVQSLPAGGFRVHGRGPDGLGFVADCKVVIDAAGKLGRFTHRRESNQFGVQFYEERPLGSMLEFRFFEGGYGGSVSIEGGRTNSCFLVNKDRVGEYLDREGCLVTGSVAYSRIPGPYLAVGDAGGMIDPFCGEGMRHAMDSGRLAARVVARGLEKGLPYQSLRENYEREWRHQWGAKRVLAAFLRRTLAHPFGKRTAFGLGSQFRGVGAELLRQLWK